VTRRGPAFRLAVAVAVSVSVHAGFFLALAFFHGARREQPVRVPISLVQKERKDATEPEPRIRPEPPPREEPVTTPRAPKPSAIARVARKTPKPPPSPAPPAPETPTPQASPGPASPRTFGIRLENPIQAAPGTGVAVPVGETLQTVPSAPAAPRPRLTAPGGTGTGEDRSTAIAAVQEMPKVLQDSKADYPDEARRLGVQGKVVLELLIDEHGAVARSRVVRKLHPLLDAAALEASRRLRFQPARVDGQPVPVKIPYTYVFVLD